MFCPNCGAQAPDGSSNCPNCGVPLAANSAPVPPRLLRREILTEPITTETLIMRFRRPEKTPEILQSQSFLPL